MNQDANQQTSSSTPNAKAIGRSIDIYYRDLERSARMDRLNAQFLPPDGLAFDIGAHVGDRTASFLRLGASVVSLEPQPFVFRALQLIHGHHGRASLQRAAVGAQSGAMSMRINSANPTVSTLSPNLIEAAQTSPDWRGQIWDAGVCVPVTTLDALINQHGRPHFTKIDVEGFELEVLRGLNTSLPALSFEVTMIQRDVGLACVQRLCDLADYEFNFSLGEEHTLQHTSWLDQNAISDFLTKLPATANSGDVYARQIGC